MRRIFPNLLLGLSTGVLCRMCAGLDPWGWIFAYWVVICAKNLWEMIQDGKRR